MTAASKYQRLTDAQNQIVTDIAGIFPSCLYPTVGYATIPTLTPDSANQTFTFGTDSNGFALTPMGRASIYPSLDSIPSNPWIAGVDYIPLGGTAIQIPNNGSYGGTLYWRGISPPGIIDGSGSHEPVLFPESARLLIAYRAAINFLLEASRDPDQATRYMGLYGRPFGPAPGMFATQMQEWKTQWRGGGALGSLTGMQVAVGSSFNANAGY